MEKNYEDVTQHLFSVSWKEQKFGISIPGYAEFQYQVIPNFDTGLYQIFPFGRK